MRKRLLCFTIFFMTTTVCVANEYHEMMNKCDEIAELKQQTALSTIQMVQVVDEQKDCYKNVVDKIIDTRYAQNKQKMTSEFDKFINAASELAYSMQYPDTCTPNCGTIVGLNAASAELKMIKTYVQQLLYIVSPE